MASSRIAFTAAPAGRPVTISVHVAPLSRVRYARGDPGERTTAYTVFESKCDDSIITIGAPPASGGVAGAQFAPLSRVTKIAPSSVPIQITRLSTYEGDTVEITPFGSPGLISAHVCPAFALFQSEFAAKSSVFGSIGRNTNGALAPARRLGPRGGETSSDWPLRRSKRV